MLALALALGWLLLAPGLLLILLDDADLRANGTLATADVLDVETGTRITDNADVRFELPDGTQVRTNIDIESVDHYPVEGETMEVRYNPASPSEGVVVAHVDRISYWIETAALMLILVGLSGVGVAAVAGIIEPSRHR